MTNQIVKSVIVGGNNNNIQGGGGSEFINNSSIIGGRDNELLDAGERSSILGGGGNTIIGEYRTNFFSAITTNNNTIIGGSGNTLNKTLDSSIINGKDNTIESQERSLIIGGSGNTLNGYPSNNPPTVYYGSDNVILGGVGNEIQNGVNRSAIIAGTNNYIEVEGGIMNSVIAGGKDNSIDLALSLSDGSFIGGGHSNTISGFSPVGSPIISSIIGGSGNTIDDLSNVHIIGCKDVTGTTEDTVYVPNLEVTGQAYTPIYDNLTGGTTFIPDWDNSNVQILTLSGNTNVSGGTTTMKGGSTYTMLVKQSNGGTHTITWDSTYKWEAGSPPTLTIADGSVDIITFICDGTSLYGLIAKDFQ